MKNYNNRKWYYLEELQIAIKQKLKGDATLTISQDDIMHLQIALNLGRSTLERFFGIDNPVNRSYPRQPTRDKLASYVGYKDFNSFVISKTNSQPIDTLLSNEQNNASLYLLDLKTKPAVINNYHRKLSLALSDCGKRLNTLFKEGTPSIKPTNIQDNYLNYQYISTLYRLFSVLGWLHIIRKDWSYFHKIQGENTIYQTITVIHQSLATNSDYYRQKLILLLKTLPIPIQQENINLEKSVIIKLQYLLSQYSLLPSNQNSNHLETDLLNGLHQLLITHITDYQLDLKQLISYKSTIINILSGKEAWIYEDWQIAIGELMVKNDPLNENYFTVIDYDTFEQWFTHTKTPAFRWILRIQKLFDQLDFSINPLQDARINQLKNTYQSMQKLLNTLDVFNNQSFA